MVLDGSKELNDYDKWLLEETKNRNPIIVTNKGDVSSISHSPLVISALTKNIEPLIHEINERYKQTKDFIEQPLLSNSRQISLMNQAYESILKVIEGCEMGLELDLVNIDLTQCYDHLANIIMPKDQINLLSEIFSRFCLGK